MSKERSGEAFDRLRAADPAAGLEPDHGSLRRAVTARGEVVDELATRRRRPVRALQVAAAGAGAVAIGVSGFALGGGFAASIVADGVGESTASAAPAIKLDSGPPAAGAAPEAGVSNSAVPGGVAEQSRAGGADGMGGMADTSYLPYTGRIVFSHSGLSTSGASGVAYSYDAAGAYSKDALRTLAEALGVKGEVREEYGSLVIGDYESGEPVVSLYSDGTASFHFNDPTKDIWFCDAAAEGECEERDFGDAPQGDEAIAQAREFLVTLGLDPASFEFEASSVEDFGSADYSNVNAFRVLDGQRTGDTWGVSFTGAGLQSGWGSLAELVDIGSYDVVSPAEAVERLNDPRFGAAASTYPPGWMGPAARTLDGVEPSTPRTIGSGDSFDWPVDSVTITSSRLGLAQHHLGDGAVALVPSYELSADDGRVWSVIAVTEAHLNFG